MLVVVDFNNVRGKTGFQATTAVFLEQLAAWAHFTGIAPVVRPADGDNEPLKGGGSGGGGEDLGPGSVEDCRVVVVVDHGLVPSATVFKGLVVTFAGTDRTADDVIAESVGELSQVGGRDVLVFTSDRELASRCLTRGRPSGRQRLKSKKQAAAAAAQAAERRKRGDEGTPLSDTSTGAEATLALAAAAVVPAASSKPGAVRVCASQTLITLMDYARGQTTASASAGRACQVVATAEALGGQGPGACDTVNGSGGSVDVAGGLRGRTAVSDPRLGPLLAAEARFRHAAAQADTRHFKTKRLRRTRVKVATALVEKAGKAAGVEVGAEAGEASAAQVVAAQAAALAETDAVAVLAGLSSPFSERTWHRVLSAEKLRRALLHRNTDGCGATTGTAETAKRAARKEKEEEGATGAPRAAPSLMRDYLHGQNSVEGSGRPSSDPRRAKQHALLWDHRLRHDRVQQTKLLKFIFAQTDAGGEAGAAGNAALEEAGALLKAPVPRETPKAAAEAVVLPLVEVPASSPGEIIGTSDLAALPRPSKRLSRRQSRRGKNLASGPSAALAELQRESPFARTSGVASDEQVESWLN